MIPYCRCMSERLVRVHKRHGISMYAMLGNTLSQALIVPTDVLKPDKKCGVVYSMECDTCDGEYVGETGRV